MRDSSSSIQFARRSHLAQRSLVAAAVGAVASMFALVSPTRAADVSAPAMLQLYEASWRTIENRSADIFSVGYGGMWIPPVSRADSGNQSVGYDVYDRFDLGSPNNGTLYGTKTGLKFAVNALHGAGVNVYADLVWNHNGYSNLGSVDGNGVTFQQAGGYPGFVLQTGSQVDGDFHGANESGDWNGRTSNLIDIAQEKNLMYIRSPIDPSDPRNLPAGTATAFGRRANVPTASNRQFYPDQQLGGQTFFDPRTNSNHTIYNFNTADKTAGDAVTENATGYLMRNTRWMLQELGLDGFRIDAAKHMPPWVLNYYDIATYKGITRKHLDGSERKAFAFSEVYDGNMALHQQYIRKDYNGDQISGNRDSLDFPLYFAMAGNLGSNGQSNNWNNIKNASLDVNDDGLANNGSQGVAFVQAHDGGLPAPYLSHVAYAYTLMRPGNAIVYMNAKEFGNGRDFPRDGRGDALGGYLWSGATQTDDYITKLVDIRNTHGRGNYADRTPAADTKELLVYERSNSALIGLSNRIDNGFDTRTVQTAFAPGTPLVELTGNASDATVDPNDALRSVVVVAADGTATVRIPRNKNSNGVEHGRGYVIYGPSAPQGSLSLSNVAQTLAGGVLTPANNGTTRTSAIQVVTAPTFGITLNTTKRMLVDNGPNGVGSIHDHDADGDFAILSIDKNFDVNNNGTVDFRTPGQTTYGFDEFTVKNPGYSSADNNGSYSQVVDTTKLSEGYHYVTARAYRHRNANEPEIFRDFKQTIYVDRLKPVSAVATFNPYDGGTVNRDLDVQSTDQTATSVQVLMDQPANLTEAEILAIVGTNNNKMTQVDRDLFRYGFANTGSGNHAFTIVTREITGNYNVQRIVGVNTQGTRGRGLGDVDFNNNYNITDVNTMVAAVYPNTLGKTNHTFLAGGDFNADGLIDSNDLYSMRDRYEALGQGTVSITGMSSVKAAVLERGDVNNDGVTNSADISFLMRRRGDTAWTYDLNASAWYRPGMGADFKDVDTLVRVILRTQYGDTDLSGKIDGIDYGNVDSSFAIANGDGGGGMFPDGEAKWSDGDFNGDGTVNGIDYGIIDYYYLLENESGSIDGSTPGIGSRIARAVRYLEAANPSGDPSMLNDQYLANVHEHFGQFGEMYANAFLAQVPEPATIGTIIALGVAGLLKRRRRTGCPTHHQRIVKN